MKNLFYLLVICLCMGILCFCMMEQSDIKPIIKSCDYIEGNIKISNLSLDGVNLIEAHRYNVYKFEFGEVLVNEDYEYFR